MMDSHATLEPMPIFVYGTLMLGQPNDHIWGDSIADVDIAFISKGCLYDLGAYPVYIDEPHYDVRGQLIRVRQDHYLNIIRSLDILEGHDSERPQLSTFRRVQKRVLTLTGDAVMAWIYVGNREQVQGLPVVEQGDWAKHVVEMGVERNTF